MDPLLRAFHAAVRADSPSALLEALLRPQLESQSLLGFLGPDVFDIVDQACRTPTAESLRTMGEVFRQYGLYVSNEANPSPALRLFRTLVILDLSSAYLLLGDTVLFYRGLLEAAHAVHEAGDASMATMIVDIGWPLTWYRVRKYPMETPMDLSLNMVLEGCANEHRDDLALHSILKTSAKAFEIFQHAAFLAMGGVELAGADNQTILHHRHFIDRAMEKALEVDSANARWGLARIIQAFA